MAASIVAAILYFILTLNITIAKKLITQNNYHDLYLNTSSDLALTLTHYYLQHTVHASCHGVPTSLLGRSGKSDGTLMPSHGTPTPL